MRSDTEHEGLEHLELQSQRPRFDEAVVRKEALRRRLRLLLDALIGVIVQEIRAQHEAEILVEARPRHFHVDRVAIARGSRDGHTQRGQGWERGQQSG